MTDRNREELIEEAATMLRHYGYGHLADGIEAVFEQAHTPTEHECTWACWVDRYGQDHHTPTSDEREVLAEDYVDTLNQVWHHRLDVLSAAHRLAGFRRTVQAEPTVPPRPTEDEFASLPVADLNEFRVPRGGNMSMKSCEYCDHSPGYKSYDGGEEIDICGCCIAEMNNLSVESDVAFRAECEGVLE